MQYDELKNNILKARDMRWETLRMLAAMYPDRRLVTVCANIAGADKDTEAARRLIGWAEDKLRSLAAVLTVGAYGDAAGYIVFMASAEDIQRLKPAATDVEQYADYCRLLDIDVYDNDLNALSRTELGMSPRKCLLCGDNAADCARTRKHDISSIIDETNRLLDKFVRTEQSPR